MRSANVSIPRGELTGTRQVPICLPSRDTDTKESCRKNCLERANHATPVGIEHMQMLKQRQLVIEEGGERPHAVFLKMSQRS